MDDLIFYLVIVVLIIPVIIGAALFVDYAFVSGFPPCLAEDMEEVHAIDGVKFYRCCESNYTIEGDEFIETKECKIIEGKLALFDRWFGV